MIYPVYVKVKKNSQRVPRFTCPRSTMKMGMRLVDSFTVDSRSISPRLRGGLSLVYLGNMRSKIYK